MVSKIIPIFAHTNLKEFTLGRHKKTDNYLLMRAVEQNTPPTSLDNEPQENGPQCDDKLSSYAINLIRRLLLIADEDYNDISITDRKLLEEVLTGTSLDVIARRRDLTAERIRQRVRAALDLLHQKLEAWQVAQQQLKDLDAKASQMEAELEVRAKQIEELQQGAIQHVKEASRGLIRLQPKAAKALTREIRGTGL